MLPKSKRISKDSFKMILTQGGIFHSAHFTLRTLPSPVTGFAVSISKKVAPTSVLRNKIRRRVYSFLHTALPAIKKTSKNIISAKSGAQKLSFDLTKEEISELLKKALH